MTALSKRKSRLCVEFSDCKREQGKLREVIMDFDPHGYSARLRLKGLRSSFPISAVGLYDYAVRLSVDKARAEKKAAKKKSV